MRFVEPRGPQVPLGTRAGSLQFPTRRPATDTASESPANRFAGPNGEEENEQSKVNTPLTHPIANPAGHGPTQSKLKNPWHRT